MKKLLIGTACVLASGSLMAAAMPVHRPMPTGPYGWYAGVGINKDATMSETVTSNNTGMKWTQNKSHPSWQLFAGYRLSKYFGNEMMFSHFGHNQYYNKPNLKESTYDRFAVSYDALAFLPLHQYFEMFVKGGVDYYYARASNYIAGVYDKRAKISTFGGNFGAGLQFNWRMLAARVQYTNYEAMMTANTQGIYEPSNVVSFDVLYRFG